MRSGERSKAHKQTFLGGAATERYTCLLRRRKKWKEEMLHDRPRVMQHIEEELVVVAVVADPFLNVTELATSGLWMYKRRQYASVYRSQGFELCGCCKAFPDKATVPPASGICTRASALQPKRMEKCLFFFRMKPFFALGGTSSDRCEEFDSTR